jgi:thiamine biosynthesis protein ThiS
VTITLNGDPFDMPTPLTVTQLLEQLHIDSRRVAVEHNFIVLKRTAYDTTGLAEGDQVEIVNFVGGGEAVRTLR